MKYINKTTRQVFAPYHLLSTYPELYGVDLTDDVLSNHDLAELLYQPLPKINPWQQIAEGAIDGASQTWMVEDLPIELLKEAKFNEINAWRDSENLKPVQYQGELFDADQESQFRVLAVVMIGTGSPTGYWTSAENKDVPADAAFMQGLYAAMITRVATIHHRQRTMKSEVLAMTAQQSVYEYKVGAV